MAQGAWTERRPVTQALCLTARSLLFIRHFDCIHASVIGDGHEREHDFTLGVGGYAVEGPLHGAVVATGGPEQIEIVQQSHSVAVDIEGAAARTASAGLAWTEPALRKLESYIVAPFRHRNRVGEIAEAFGLEQIRVKGIADRLGTNHA